MYWVNAAETHETFRQESGMRYQHSPRGPDLLLSTDRGVRLPDGLNGEAWAHGVDSAYMPVPTRSVDLEATTRR